MSLENLRLIHDEEKVVESIKKKEYTYVEFVSNSYGEEFFEYLQQTGIDRDFNEAPFKKPRECIRNREVFPMLYMLNIFNGGWAVRKTQNLLLDEVKMRIMGFTDEQIRHGITKRGSKNQYGEAFKRRAGVMASTTLIDNLACFDYSGLEACFDAYVQRLSHDKTIDLGNIFILDSTIVSTPQDYPGAGRTWRKGVEDDDLDIEIFGYKVFMLMSAKTRIPVAIHITTANEADSTQFLNMIKHGIANLGKDIIKVVLADRGFLDGFQLHELKYKMGIDFAIPAKKNMDIWKCVTGLRDESSDQIEEWKYGKKGMSGGYLTKGSVSYSQYVKESIGYKKEQSGDPINAVVVTRWANNEISHGKEKVILTSLDTDSAINIIHLYGQRSLIENCGFRELKQAAALNDFPQYKNVNAPHTARIHMLLCVFTLTIFNALVVTVNTSPENAKKIPRNIREYRFISENEKPKIYMQVDNYYHFFTAPEFMGHVDFIPRKPS